AGASTPPLKIGAGGVAHLCRDLGLDPVDIRVLLLAWLCRAREMCAFTEAELRRGCAALRQAEAPTADGLRAALDARLDAMTVDVAFKDLYRWAFDFGLESGQRTLQLPMATDLWALVFEARPSGVPPLLGAWLTWLQSGASGVKGVSRDTWNMFLTFIDTCGSDLSAYDHNEAWPSLIDDFVEAETDRANQNLLNC
uniref:Defective in cullin neddylation protein n=1 Tax=Macrostomum lignano TaxID=282301 RepID=A0A1I8IZL1_9PLAT